jgi:hypothetical protein
MANRTPKSAWAALFNFAGGGLIHMETFEAPTPPEGVMRPMLCTISEESIGVPLGVTGLAAPAELAWPFSNEAILIPFTLDVPFTVAALFAINGNVVSGNLDLGIYDASLTKVIATGSTAQNGTTVAQVINVTATVLPAGNYYWAQTLNNATGKVLRYVVNQDVQLILGGGRSNTGFPLPASITGPLTRNVNVPLIGMTDNRLTI